MFDTNLKNEALALCARCVPAGGAAVASAVAKAEALDWSQLAGMVSVLVGLVTIADLGLRRWNEWRKARQ